MLENVARGAPQKGQRTGSGDQNKAAEAARTGEQLGTTEVGNTEKQAVGTRDNGVGTWEQSWQQQETGKRKGLGTRRGAETKEQGRTGGAGALRAYMGSWGRWEWEGVCTEE